MPTPPEDHQEPPAPTPDRRDPRADFEAGIREARAQFDAGPAGGFAPNALTP